MIKEARNLKSHEKNFHLKIKKLSYLKEYIYIADKFTRVGQFIPQIQNQGGNLQSRTTTLRSCPTATITKSSNSRSCRDLASIYLLKKSNNSLELPELEFPELWPTMIIHKGNVFITNSSEK